MIESNSRPTPASSGKRLPALGVSIAVLFATIPLALVAGPRPRPVNDRAVLEQRR
jgi:hypothetical protein